jgi:hypothetical protein
MDEVDDLGSVIPEIEKLVVVLVLVLVDPCSVDSQLRLVV